MCGIIAYTGTKPAAQIILEGLSSLEYRGYDSAGIAIMGPSGHPKVQKSQGRLSTLLETIHGDMPAGTSGIGHTRWATHGGPTDFNAHPHTDCKNEIAVVHNGIVENFQELRKELESAGHNFSSQTDSECIPHLIELHMQQESSLEDAVRKTAARIRGAHAIVVASQHDPGKLVAIKLGNAGGIVVGYGEDESFLASDLPPLLPHTRNVSYLSGGELASVTSSGVQFSNIANEPLDKSTINIPFDTVIAAKGEYDHFMLKEIHEQPESVVSTMRGLVSFDTLSVEIENFPLSDTDINELDKIVLVGMGTSMHAAMVARTWIETFARIPTEVDNSSEFRYRNPIIDDRTLVISVCQSGETADTLAAMEEAARKGSKQITLCNYAGTQTTRIADGTILIRAGLEIGVAASKTFTCSLTALYLLSLHLGQKRGCLTRKRQAELIKEMAHLPKMLGSIVSNEHEYTRLAQDIAHNPDFLFLGRGINYPLAMEGALKLKEISYIHAEGYPAGEMKHGPIALIDENMPVVVLMTKDNLYSKMLSNVNEAKARGGKIIAIATEGDTEVADLVDHAIYIPQASPMITPILLAVPMQLLAYQIGVLKGCNVDQPRNLAKSVTVE